MQRNEAEIGSSNVKDLSKETFQLQIPVLHQNKYIYKAGSLSLIQVWAEYNYKVSDVSDSQQNIETSCNSKLKVPNLKICVLKLQKNY